MLIIGSDLNATLEPLLDTTTPASHISYAALKRLKKLLHRFQLIDTWRISHPKGRDFTFYSAVHDSYSRIDYIMIGHQHLDRLREDTIDIISISDHPQMSITMEIMGTPRPPFQWRLNDSLIQDEDVREDIKLPLNQFFTDYNTADSDPLIVWEAHKAFIRGLLIRHGSRLKGRWTQLTTDLVKVI